MVEYSADLDRVFGALSDPTRREIVRRLSDGDSSVSDVAAPFDISLAAVSKHIRVLQDAGLVSQYRRGRERICRLEPGPLHEADTWLGYYERFWSTQLDSLNAFMTKNREERLGG
jgi:DNA-binding transcriptional ArsR family regulator